MELVFKMLVYFLQYAFLTVRVCNYFAVFFFLLLKCPHSLLLALSQLAHSIKRLNFHLKFLFCVVYVALFFGDRIRMSHSLAALQSQCTHLERKYIKPLKKIATISSVSAGKQQAIKKIAKIDGKDLEARALYYTIKA